MLSIEDAVEYAKEKGGEILEDIKNWYDEFKREIEEKTVFYLEEFNNNIHDYTKISINTSLSSIDGYTLLDILENEYDVFLECATSDIALAYLGLNTLKEDIDKLKDALISINNKNLKKEKKNDILFKEYKMVKKFSMKEAFEMEKESVDVVGSVGRICGDFVVPYPPGFPILVPGEIISKDIVDYLINIKDKQTILGIKEDNIKCVKVK